MSPVVLIQNAAIPAGATTGRTSTVGEPTLSNTGNDVFFAGNWYAAQSANHGGAWTHVDPFTVLPPVDGGFCCDQTSIQIPGANVTVWLLQYVKLNGTNTLRVAVRQPGARWRWWDFRPTMANPAWVNEWFDYNSAALSNNFLYVTSNVFDFTTNVWRRAVVLRFRITDLAAAANLPFNAFTTTTNGSLRCTLGATHTMYFASQSSTSQIRVFKWPETSTAVTSTDVNVAAWNNTRPYSAVCPDGNDWLSRCDGRITAGWLAGSEMGFAWTSNRTAQRPLPFVRAVVIDEASGNVLRQPDIWSPDIAWAYPDACPNANGAIALSVFRGGGTIFPGHVVGALDPGGWSLTATRNGSNGPADGKWGDYLTCRRHEPDQQSWIASGYTLQGGSGRNNVEPRFVHFRI